MQPNNNQSNHKETMGEKAFGGGAGIGGAVGFGYSLSTGALQAMWAAEAAQMAALPAFTIVPLSVTFTAMLPILGGAAVGGAITYTGYKIYGFFAQSEKPSNQHQNQQQSSVQHQHRM